MDASEIKLDESPVFVELIKKKVSTINQTIQIGFQYMTQFP